MMMKARGCQGMGRVEIMAYRGILMRRFPETNQEKALMGQMGRFHPEARGL
jgi:hypothetical protein